jgi:hypothetical protein
LTLRMARFQRRLFVTAWVTLSVQALVLALGALHVCWNGEHTHGGVAALDCPMHHQGSRQPDGSADHHHHGHSATADVSEGAGPQISCRCSNDLRSIVLGQVAIVEVQLSASPLTEGALLNPAADRSVVDEHFSPPFPPPRQ